MRAARRCVDDPARAERRQDDPEIDNTGADRPALVVSGAGDHRRAGLDAERGRAAGRSATDDGRRFMHRGEQGWVDAEGPSGLVAPRAPVNIEQERAGGVADIGGHLSGETESHIVLRQQHGCDARPDLRLVLTHPRQLRKGKPRQGGVADESNERRTPAGGTLDGVALLFGAGRSRGSRGRRTSSLRPPEPLPRVEYTSRASDRRCRRRQSWTAQCPRTRSPGATPRTPTATSREDPAQTIPGVAGWTGASRRPSRGHCRRCRRRPPLWRRYRRQSRAGCPSRDSTLGGSGPGMSGSTDERLIGWMDEAA